METFSEASPSFLFSSNLWSLESDPSLGVWKSMTWNLLPSHQLILIKLLPTFLRLLWTVTSSLQLQAKCLTWIFSIHGFFFLAFFRHLRHQHGQLHFSYHLLFPLFQVNTDLAFLWCRIILCIRPRGLSLFQRPYHSFLIEMCLAVSCLPLVSLQTHKPCLLNYQRPSFL